MTHVCTHAVTNDAAFRRIVAGTRVMNYRRGDHVGVVKAEPFQDLANGERRWRVWVDYTHSSGAVAIDYVRDLRIVE